ncbi:unnamed protein product, partial [Prunus brigantina]
QISKLDSTTYYFSFFLLCLILFCFGHRRRREGEIFYFSRDDCKYIGKISRRRWTVDVGCWRGGNPGGRELRIGNREMGNGRNRKYRC